MPKLRVVDTPTAVLIGLVVLLLCVIAFVLWRGRGMPARRYEHLDGPSARPRAPGAAGAGGRPVPLPVEVRERVERLVGEGRPARAINLILRQTDFEIDDAHAAVDAIAARVAKPGQSAWQAAKEADREAVRRAEEAGAGGDAAAVSSGLVGLDRAAQVEVERLLQAGHMDDAVEAVKNATGMTTRQARASLEIIRAQLQRRNAGGRPAPRTQPAAKKGKPPPKNPPRRTPPGGGRKR